MNDKYKIVIDPGHGGSDSGAVGNGIVEKDLTLKISKYMYDRFKELGIPVKITRDDDSTLDPNSRPKKVLEQFGNGRNVIVISNHINAGGGEGAEVIYALRNNSKLASMVLDELEKSGQIPRRFYQRRLPSDLSKDYYYIIRNTPNNETIIVEYGFLDNAKDAQKLKNNYKEYAEAVVKAVSNYAGYNYYLNSSNNLDDYYIVKAGDTLWSIAKRYNLTVDELKKLNKLTNNTLTIGSKLLINNNASNNDFEGQYIVKKGDTLYSIANKYGLTVDKLKSINNLSNNNLSIGQSLKVSNDISNYPIYTVKKGDTLYSIAKKFNVAVDEIKLLNNLVNNILSIDQNLIIPLK